MNKKYLSEIIEEHKDEILNMPAQNKNTDEVCGEIILITAGVGAGKNTWIQKCLTKELDDFENILFITSRKLIKQQMLKDTNFQDDYDFCNTYGANYTITHHSLKNFFETPEKFKKLLKLNIKYIVIDEIHSLIADAGYTDTAFYLQNLISFYYTHSPIKIICLSATTQNILPLFQGFKNFKHFDFTNECINVQPKTIKVITKNAAFNLLSQADAQHKMIYMANSVSDICNSYYKKLTNSFKVDKNSIGILISDDRCQSEQKNTNDSALKKCLENMPNLVENLVSNEYLPNKTNILLASSRIREGINIKDNNLTAMFCEAHSIIDIAQFSGRYRNNIETLYIIYDTNSHYLNTDIEYYELEYYFLKTFELVNINKFYSILLYQATDIKNQYFSKLNLSDYILPIQSLPNELIDRKISYLETGNKTKEYLNNFDRKYYIELLHRFHNYIRNKFPLLQYNYILNKYEVYDSKYYYIKEEYNNYNDFKKNPEQYLQEIFNSSNIIIDENIYKNKIDIKGSNRCIVLEYLSNNNLLNIPISKEQKEEILQKIYTLPNISLKAPYSSLGRLLKALDIKTKRIGTNKNNTSIILG